MRRNMDLIREILLGIEASEGDPMAWVKLNLPNRQDADVSYHVMLLHEAGLIEATNASTFQGSSWMPKRLTWEGHEFLDSARDEGLWQQAKTKLLALGGTAAIGVLQKILESLAMEKMGLAG